jgi:nitroreductase
MEFAELVKKTRTYRRFDQSHAITQQTMRYLIECARLTPSGGNMQALRYLCTCTPAWNEKVFSTVAWAGYLPEWGGPKEGERPTAYVVILTDTSVKKVTPEIDVGIVAQTLVLAATSMGLGGCMFGSVRRERLKELLALPPGLEIALVVALGKPVEKVVIEPMGSDGSVKYYRDADGTHHVPKRAISDILIDVR